MECGIMHFGEFNPLDILAAAASLQSPGHGEGTDESQSSDGEGDGEEAAEDGIGGIGDSGETSSSEGVPNTGNSVVERKFGEIIPDQHLATSAQPIATPQTSADCKVMPRVVKVLSNNGMLTENLDTDDKLVLSPKETAKMTGNSTTRTKDCTTKTVTILRIKKSQNTDHSYAVYSKLEKSRMEEDEGYCSRSSLGSPGQCWKSDSEMMDPDVLDGRDSECGPKSPYLVLPAGQSANTAAGLSDGSSVGLKNVTSTGWKAGESSSPGVQVHIGDVTVDGHNRDSSANKKCTKIVIVSRDANLRKYFRGDVEPVSTELQETASEELVESSSDSSTQMSAFANQGDKIVVKNRICSSMPTTEACAKGGDSSLQQDVCGVYQEANFAKDSPEIPLDSVHREQGLTKDNVNAGQGSESLEVAEHGRNTSDTTEHTVISSGITESDSLVADSGCTSKEVLLNAEELDGSVVTKEKCDGYHSPALLNILVNKSGPTPAELLQSSNGDTELEDKAAASSSENSMGHVQGEHAIIENKSPGGGSSSAVLPIDEDNAQSHHEMLHGLLEGADREKAGQRLLLPSSESLHRLKNSSVEKDKSSSSAGDVCNTVCGVPNKTGLVYIMSTTASDVTSNTVVTSPNQTPGAKISPSQCNKYIIQDDVPPMSKYGEVTTVQNSKTDAFPSSLAQVCKTLEPTSKLCSSKPKFVAGSKESFVLLRLSSLSAKPTKSGLITLNPGIKSPVPTSCVVPVLVNAGGSSLHHSLLSSPNKGGSVCASGSQSNIHVSPAGVTKSVKVASTCMPSALLKKTDSNTKKEDLTSLGTTAIPRSWSSLLSSQKLLSCSSLIAMQPLVASQEPSVKNRDDLLDSSLKTVTSLDGHNHTTVSICDSTECDKTDSERSALLDQSGSAVLSLEQRATPYEGRLTPLGFAAASDDGSAGNINIKISGGVVIDVQQEKSVRDLKNKSSCSIGQVGSLTWQNVSPPVIDAAARFLPMRHGRTMLTAASKKEGLSDALLVELKKKHPKARVGMPSRAELYRMKESAQNISELHPLIDHDYCMFTEFSADIQSSIIATMDTKIKPERKSVKKAKAARTKLYQAPATQTKVDPKLKKRKYTKRKLNQLLQRVKSVVSEVSNENDDMDEKQSSGSSNVSASIFMSGQLKEKFRDRKPKRHYRPRNSGDKNYVKIPGSYQDEFVYYATKKQRGRPRKFEEEHQETTAKSGITSINEFEWYREMAKIDKGSKFGVAGVGSNNITKPNSLELLHKIPDYSHNANANMPIQESDVVDMVIDMMPSSELEVTPTMDSSKIFGVLMNNEGGHGENLQGESHSEGSTGSRLDVAASSHEETIESTVDPGVMAEFNRLLNSMEEAEQLKILVNLTDGQGSGDKQDKDRDGLGKVDGMLNNLNAYLGSYSTETHSTGSSMAIGQSQSQFLDLDEINDNDLLNTSELGNIFGDLSTASATPTTASLSVMSTAGDSLPKITDSEFANFADSSCSSYSMESNVVDLPNMEPQLHSADPPSAFSGMPSAFGKPLDKRELFPDISNTVPQVSTEFGVPDLTLVNMYWNELPGLLINGKEYVRLVDIHKQVLPAKDTGILKKRCQMMGLDIMNCSELQRDFLIRYMNAAKSKSCVIVAKEAAKTLIGFYVDPRPRMLNKQQADPYTPAKSRSGPSKLKVLLPTRKESKVNISVDEELMTADSAGTIGASTSTTSCPTSGSRSGKQKASRHTNSAEDLSNLGPSTVTRNRQEVNMKDIKRSPRLKNKKVMYAALHNGGWAEEEEPVRTQSPDTKGTTDCVTVSNSECKDEVLSEENANIVGMPETDLKAAVSKRSRHLTSTDEFTLAELVTKQSDCKLNSTERRRISRLQKKIRKHKLLSHHNELEILEKWLKNLERAKLRRLEKKALTDKYSLEHCYAASPEPRDRSIKSVKAEPGSALCAEQTTDAAPQQESSVEDEDSIQVGRSDQSPRNKSQKHSGMIPAASKSRHRLKTTRLGNGEIQQTLQVVHMDSVQHSHGQKNRSQGGTLYLSKYQSREAACIECNTCHEMLSVRRFLKHRHHLNNPDELVDVSLPQKLELSPPPQAEMRSDEVHLWAQFTQRRQTFSQLLPKRRHPSKVKATSKRRSAVHRIRGTVRKQFALASNKAGISVDNDAGTGKQYSAQNGPRDASETSPETALPDDSSRHSGRIRKRKQLYPMESYVFGHSSPQGSPPTKRARHSVHFRGSPA